jgi:predicted Fe-Mo cluster-binding NifX family protein
MRIGLAAHEGRVSPVLDVAQRLLVVDVNGQAENGRQDLALTSSSLATRVRDIQHAAVDVLICGAVSQPLEAVLSAAGIRVLSRICGPIENVLSAFLADGLSDGAYLMPGCCGRGRQRRGGCGGGRRHMGG